MALEMAGGQKEGVKKTEWKNETGQRENSVREFLKNHFSRPTDSRQRYDSTSELHTSGTNAEVFPKISKGKAVINEIGLYYGNDQPKQTHVVFDSEGKGHNIDVYMKGKALEDYLASCQPKN